MSRRRSSIGLFGLFGRSDDLRQLDEALRAIDVHPRMVSEAVKLTIVNLLKDHAVGDRPAPQSYRAAAEIVGYCMLGAEAFAGANDVDLALRVERRIDAALAAGGGLDAQLLLLAIHSGIVQPSVVQDFGLESVGGRGDGA